MQLVINMIMLFLVAIALETLAYVGIGELFNKVYKKTNFDVPLSLGKRLFTTFKESFRLSRTVKNSSETLEPEFIEKMDRTPLSVIITLFVVILWCITGIAWYIIKFDTVIAVLIMAAILIIAVIAGIKLSDKKKSDGTTVEKCMKCKISKLTTYRTVRQQTKTFADVRMPNGSIYKMIPVVNYLMRDHKEKSIDIYIYCVVYYDYLPLAKCVIDPKDLPKIK